MKGKIFLERVIGSQKKMIFLFPSLKVASGPNFIQVFDIHHGLFRLRQSLSRGMPKVRIQYMDALHYFAP